MNVLVLSKCILLLLAIAHATALPEYAPVPENDTDVSESEYQFNFTGGCSNSDLTPGGRHWQTPDTYCSQRNAYCISNSSWTFQCICYNSNEHFDTIYERCTAYEWGTTVSDRNSSESYYACYNSRLTPGGRYWQTPDRYCSEREAYCISYGSSYFECKCRRNDHRFDQYEERCVAYGWETTVSPNSTNQYPCQNRDLTPRGRYWQTPESYCQERNASCYSMNSTNFYCHCWDWDMTFSEHEERCVPSGPCSDPNLTPFGRSYQTPNNYCSDRNAYCKNLGNTNFFCQCYERNRIFSPYDEYCADVQNLVKCNSTETIIPSNNTSPGLITVFGDFIVDKLCFFC